jgi:ABC-type tungstate transport system substrate-binding protein
MDNFISGFQDAIQLIINLDPEFFEIVRLSMVVSLTATFLAAIVAIPFGTWLGIKEFPGKRILVRIIYTLMSMPPVVIGLVLFLLFLRNGPLGEFRLNFTATAMSEVGAVMVVGGNIKGHTRIMTTTIAMLRNMGEYSLAIATGIVLLLISFLINSLLYHWQQER